MENKFTNYLFALFLVPSLIFAQIDITKTEYTSFFSIGKTYYSFADTLTETIDIGSPGGGNNWDFANLTAHEIFAYEILAAPATPYADSFATADIATYFSFMENQGNGSSSSESWAYYNSNDATVLGAIGNNTFTDMSGTLTTQTVTKHYPPYLEYDFPITANKTWVSTDSSETILYYQGFPSSIGSTASVDSVHIDAWGTMIMPSGKTIPALRSREVSTTTTYLFPIGSTVSTSLTYYFMGENGESLSISVDEDESSHSGMRTGSIGWSIDEVTSVEKLDVIPKEFSLKQNYPNPFNPSTKIEYSITKPSHVSLRVYDILGNEVARLVNEDQTIGNYRTEFDGSELSSGTYFVQLTAGDFSKVRKISLIK